jgi:Mycothiol maleylpyruvate isomerase N-terminal domain
MATATAYLDRVLPAIDRLAERFAALVTAVPDPAAPIPDSEWTVRDATAHVVSVTRRFIDGPEGRGTWVADPRELGSLNDTQNQTLAGLDLAELATMLRRDLTALAAQVRAYGAAPPSFRFHGGEPVAADVALGMLLCAHLRRPGRPPPGLLPPPIPMAPHRPRPPPRLGPPPLARLHPRQPLPHPLRSQKATDRPGTERNGIPFGAAGGPPPDRL